MLDLKLDRSAVPPKDAATIVLVRDTAGGGVEVFCVERSKQSRFLGGAIVFPGGKLDASDASEQWSSLSTDVRAPARASEPFTKDAAHLRALAVAACREMLEEAAMLLVSGEVAPPSVTQDDLFALRARLGNDAGALRAFLLDNQLRLDLQALYPLARWITPEAEARRYDTRFFVAIAPANQTGAHDEHETMASFWATPSEVLRRWEDGLVQLAPPTHRTLTLMSSCSTAEAVLELALTSSVDPICPRLLPQKGSDTLALVLPGDPEHDVREARVFGPSRYVLRGDRWLAEDAPR